MPKITAPLRGRRGSKRLDITDLREVLRDRRMWSAIGIVTKPDDGEHFEEVEGPADVLVEVVLQPSLVPVTCRLPAVFFTVPVVGEEVAVLIPEGQCDFMPTIIAILSTNSLPTAQGPAEGRIAIVRGEVVVHDGNGGAVSLALKSDVEAVDNKYSAHVHQDSTSAPTSAPMITALPNPSGPVPPFIPGPPLADAGIVGTTVLKAK